jgi:hypothetical protein
MTLVPKLQAARAIPLYIPEREVAKGCVVWVMELEASRRYRIHPKGSPEHSRKELETERTFVVHNAVRYLWFLMLHALFDEVGIITPIHTSEPNIKYRRASSEGSWSWATLQVWE